MRISDWSSDVCSSDLAVTAAMQKWLRRPVYSLRVVPGERGAYEEAAASKGSRTGVLSSPAYYRLPDDGGFGSATISRSEEHTSDIQSLMRISYAVFCLKQKKYTAYIAAHVTVRITHPIAHE